jgi:hypothetical protein
MLAARQHHSSKRNLIERANGFSDHGVCVVADLTVWRDVVGANEIQIVDFLSRNELVDLDGACGFERNVFQLILGNLKVCVGVDLVTFDDVLVGNFLAGVGIDLLIFDAMTGFPVDLIEADLL